MTAMMESRQGLGVQGLGCKLKTWASGRSPYNSPKPNGLETYCRKSPALRGTWFRAGSDFLQALPLEPDILTIALIPERPLGKAHTRIPCQGNPVTR